MIESRFWYTSFPNGRRLEAYERIEDDVVRIDFQTVDQSTALTERVVGLTLSLPVAEARAFALATLALRPAPKDLEKRNDVLLSELAVTFPSLRGRPGLAPWNARAFEAWLMGPAPSSGMLHAGRFLLHVWNANASWGCGRFDAIAAMNVWDAAHVAAFAMWAARPWFA